MIYLDNAATSGKKPQAVVNSVKYALENLNANAGRSGHLLSLRASEEIYRARELAADFFGADDAAQVVFTQNCTHSINQVLKGVLKSGDRVIVSDLEHNAVMRPLNKMGIGFSVAEVSFYDDNLTISAFERLITADTKMIFVTAASNVWGKKLPLAKLGALCKSRGLQFGVDAAQGAGIMTVNMRDMGIDYLCIAPHKGLYAPMGLGILIARRPIENTLIEGGTGTNSLELTQPMELPERLESGTVNLPAIMGAAVGIKFVQKMGVDKIAAHEMKLIKKLHSELSSNKNVILYTPAPDVSEYAPVLSFNLRGLGSAEAAQELSKRGFAVRGGLHCAPMAHKLMGTLDMGAVRVAPSVFNTSEDIERLAYTLKNLKKINT